MSPTQYEILCSVYGWRFTIRKCSNSNRKFSTSSPVSTTSHQHTDGNSEIFRLIPACTTRGCCHHHESLVYQTYNFHFHEDTKGNKTSPETFSFFLTMRFSQLGEKWMKQKISLPDMSISFFEWRFFNLEKRFFFILFWFLRAIFSDFFPVKFWKSATSSSFCCFTRWFLQIRNSQSSNNYASSTACFRQLPSSSQYENVCKVGLLNVAEYFAIWQLIQLLNSIEIEIMNIFGRFISQMRVGGSSDENIIWFQTKDDFCRRLEQFWGNNYEISETSPTTTGKCAYMRRRKNIKGCIRTLI